MCSWKPCLFYCSVSAEGSWVLDFLISCNRFYVLILRHAETLGNSVFWTSLDDTCMSPIHSTAFVQHQRQQHCYCYVLFVTHPLKINRKVDHPKKKKKTLVTPTFFFIIQQRWTGRSCPSGYRAVDRLEFSKPQTFHLVWYKPTVRCYLRTDARYWASFPGSAAWELR